MINNLENTSIDKSLRQALLKGWLRDEDSVVIFYDLSFLEERIRYLKSLFPGNTLHGLAVKANPLIRLMELTGKLGVGVEAASMGEVHLALKTGYKPDQIVYDSPVKTFKELEFALKTGIHINIDNFSELNRVNKLLNNFSSESSIGIRINPQVGEGTILESSVAGEYSKFGIPIKTGRQALEKAFLDYPWLTGIHLHVGSQGCSLSLLIKGIGVLYDFMQEINEKRNQSGLLPVTIFDIGGGMPVSYKSDSEPPSMEEYVNSIRKRAFRLLTADCLLITEFGRWVYTNAAWTVSRVEYVKHDPGINTAMIHTGADLFVRECLNPHDWQHEYTVYTPSGKRKTGQDDNLYNLAGPLCFSGDILAKGVKLPLIEEGDFLVIHDSGSYTFSMWSRYNSRQTPRIVGYFNDGERFELIKEMETFEELYGFWK